MCVSPKHLQSQVVAFNVQHIRDQPGGGRFFHDVESAHFHLQQLRGRRVRPGQDLVPGVRGGGRLHGLSAGHHQRVHRIRQIQVSPTHKTRNLLIIKVFRRCITGPLDGKVGRRQAITLVALTWLWATPWNLFPLFEIWGRFVPGESSAVFSHPIYLLFSSSGYSFICFCMRTLGAGYLFTCSIFSHRHQSLCLRSLLLQKFRSIFSNNFIEKF